MGFLPYDAPAPKARSFENIARVVTDEIIRLGDAVGMAGRLKELPKSRDGSKTANPNDPYWDFVLETLDAKFASDGNPLLIILSTRLTDIDGEWLDNTNRPYITAQAFAGLGVRAVPFTPEAAARFPHLDMGIDPNYDPAEIVGRVFRLKNDPASQIRDRKGEQLGRDLYLPVERFDADYVYRGEVRLVTANKGGVGVDANGTPATASVIDVSTNSEASQAVAAALVGVEADDDAAMTVLRAANLGNLSLRGSRFLELIADDKLVISLADAGVVTVVDGRIAPPVA